MIKKKGKFKVIMETEQKIAKILSTIGTWWMLLKNIQHPHRMQRDPSPLWNKERKLQRETNIRRKDNKVVWQTCGLTEFQEKLECKKQNPNQH